MSLRHVPHILAKDTRRLWWTIALTLLLLFRLAHDDSWRAGVAPGATEGWLNLLLPLAWSFLIGMLVLEDPPTGDSAFCLTLPCTGSTLFVAKALFIALFVHVPYFVACWWIVGARGFSPWEYLPALFAKQCVVLVVTLSALALASLAGNIARFLMGAILFAALAGAPTVLAVQPLRHTLECGILAIGAIAIVALQYARFHDVASRAVAALTLAGASVIWLLSPSSINALEAALFPVAPDSRLTIQLSTNAASRDNRIRGVLPVEVAGMKPGIEAHIYPLEVHFLDGTGHDQFRQASGSDFNSRILVAQAASRVGDAVLTARGRALVQLYRRSDAISTSVGRAVTTNASSRCTTWIDGDTESTQFLQVACETPGSLWPARVEVLDPATGRIWKTTLGAARRTSPYPVGTWLSPVNRNDSLFQISDETVYAHTGAQWMLPREVLPTAVISIDPEIPAGSAIIDYEIPGIRLNDYRKRQ